MPRLSLKFGINRMRNVNAFVVAMELSGASVALWETLPAGSSTGRSRGTLPQTIFDSLLSLTSIS